MALYPYHVIKVKLLLSLSRHDTKKWECVVPAPLLMWGGSGIKAASNSLDVMGPSYKWAVEVVAKSLRISLYVVSPAQAVPHLFVSRTRLLSLLTSE